MGKIKQGLDYFPVNTDFMHDRIVRRVMKREGDSAFAILLYTLSYIYSGEGYYVLADDDFYDELSDQLFTTDNDRVRSVLRLFVEYGFFDASLYERCRILTSADIQRQYLFVVKRRNRRRHILPDYCLLPDDPLPAPAADDVADESPATPSGNAANPSATAEDTVCKNADTVYKNADTVYNIPENCNKNGSHKRKEKERKEKENILPNPPCEGGDEEGGGNSRDKPSGGKKTRELTQADIDAMQPPADGCQRNFQGLLENLRMYRVPPAEQYAIVLKSNYGELGGEVWKAFYAIRFSGGKIKLPGHYLLSVLNR